jgi:hypothetical protein
MMLNLEFSAICAEDVPSLMRGRCKVISNVGGV